MIETKFWSDSYVSNLNPKEKLLFLYLLTNSYTNVAGIYELEMKYIVLETGLKKKEIEKIIQKFSADDKIFCVKGFFWVKNFRKYQNFGNSKIKAAIENILSKLPDEIRKFIDDKELKKQTSEKMTHTYPIDDLSMSHLCPIDDPSQYNITNNNINKTILQNAAENLTNQENKNPIIPKKEEIFDIRFDQFWDMYDKKRNKEVCKSLWSKLTDDEIKQIFINVPLYVKATPDVKYRKDPERYLRRKCWLDEIINNNQNEKFKFSNNGKYSGFDKDKYREILDSVSEQ